MKVLLINGSSRKEGCTFTALTEVAKSLEKNGIDTEIIHLGANAIVTALDAVLAKGMITAVFLKMIL